MTKWDIVFDGSEDVGKIRFGDGVLEVVASFKDDHDARLFFGLMNEMRDELLEAEMKISRVLQHVREAAREGSK